MYSYVHIHTHTHAHTPSHLHALPHTHIHTLPLTYVQVIALLALALVAGFSTSTSADCRPPGGNTNVTITYSASYPFETYSNTTVFHDNHSINPSITQTPFSDGSITQTAKFFVVWGAITLVQCVGSILVYMFVTANQRLEKVFDFLVYCVSGCQKLCACLHHLEHESLQALLL